MEAKNIMKSNNFLNLDEGWICPNCGKVFMTFPIFSGDCCNNCYHFGLKPISSLKEDLNKLKEKEKKDSKKIKINIENKEIKTEKEQEKGIGKITKKINKNIMIFENESFNNPQIEIGGYHGTMFTNF